MRSTRALMVLSSVWIGCGTSDAGAPSSERHTDSNDPVDFPSSVVPQDPVAESVRSQTSCAAESKNQAPVQALNVPAKSYVVRGPAVSERPLHPNSPWPKFRANMHQTGSSSIVPSDSGGHLWKFKTGKGIFSSAIVSEDGTVYIGSADQTFYALRADGSLRWQLQTDGIIDSSALLDDAGRVYFGSGDGILRAVDAGSGELFWAFEAEHPAVNKAFINWFEGNVAIAPQGDLYVPNDNFSVYVIDRHSGKAKRRWLMNDQTWSLPAIDRGTGNVFIGNNYIAPFRFLGVFWKNMFALTERGNPIWRHGIQSSVVASPVIASGLVVVGAFDGYLRAFDAATGRISWSFETADHIYASAASSPDNTIIQPSTDGSVYALDAATGSIRWRFDSREPIRSSPAIDGQGNTYFGSGDGRLYVLNPDGTRRWSLQLIEEDRNDLNSSPALGNDAIIIGGESGEIFSVPYDYCLRPEGRADGRCIVGPNEEDPPGSETLLYFTTPFGSTLASPPASIDANQVLAFSLVAHRHGDLSPVFLNEAALRVVVDPPTPVHAMVSGDRRFLTVVPDSMFAGPRVRITLQGDTLVDASREGLRFTGGRAGARFDQTFEFDIRPDALGYEFAVPNALGDPASAIEIYRCAVPLPTILPSYNQIGFDSLHYLVGAVEGGLNQFVGWFVGGKSTAAGETVPDPRTKVLFPVEVSKRNGLVTFANHSGFVVNALNADIAFDSFRVSMHLDRNNTLVSPPVLHATTNCRNIPTYGQFLINLGLCNPQTKMLNTFGSFSVRAYGGRTTLPAGVGTVTFEIKPGGWFSSPSVLATLRNTSLKLNEHAYAILLIDVETGRPIPLQYGLTTERTGSPTGEVQSVSTPLKVGGKASRVRAYLMVDTYPAAMATLDLP